MEDTLSAVGSYAFGVLICLVWEGILTMIAYCAFLENCREWGRELARRSKTKKDPYDWMYKLTATVTVIFFVIYAAPIIYLQIATGGDDGGVSWLVCGIISFVLWRVFYFLCGKISGKWSTL